MFLFASHQLAQLKLHQLAQMRVRVASENPDYLLNVNEIEYVDHIVSEFEIPLVVLGVDAIEASSSSKLVPAELFPQNSFVERGARYQKQVITFHVPFSGNSNLLLCSPATRELASFEVRLDVQKGEIQHDVVDFYNNPGTITNAKDRFVAYASNTLTSLNNDLSLFHAELRTEVQKLVSAARAKHLEHAKLLSALDVPIRRNPNVPATFSVPAVIPKKVVVRPTASPGPYQPEPVLDDGIYQEILQIIHDTGKTMERLPSTYSGRDEETLRDHLLLVLQPRFEGSATGETFNRAGKTDILLRYENHNIFVAECKFWGGAKKHHETIDQLLSYLTWRDSKTAVVYFVDTKAMIAPLVSIEESTPKHPCFVAYKGKRDESWFIYEMHIPGDHGRRVHMAVLCFHLPKA